MEKIVQSCILSKDTTKTSDFAENKGHLNSSAVTFLWH